MTEFINKNPKLSIFIGLLLLGMIGSIINPQGNSHPNKPQIAFDSPQKTIALMENTGIGRFPKYHCGSDGSCQAFIASRPEPKEAHATTGISIQGVENRVDLVVIDCIIWSKIKNKEGSRQYFYDIAFKAIASLGFSEDIASKAIRQSTEPMESGAYSIESTIAEDTYKVTISRNLQAM